METETSDCEAAARSTHCQFMVFLDQMPIVSPLRNHIQLGFSFPEFPEQLEDGVPLEAKAALDARGNIKHAGVHLLVGAATAKVSRQDEYNQRRDSMAELRARIAQPLEGSPVEVVLGVRRRLLLRLALRRRGRRLLLLLPGLLLLLLLQRGSLGLGRARAEALVVGEMIDSIAARSPSESTRIGKKDNFK